MSNQLSGSFGLAYRGTIANQPPNWNFEQRDPTPYDSSNYSLGDLWLNEATKSGWVLVSLVGNSLPNTPVGMIAKWIQFAGNSGNVQSLTGNSGGPIFPLNNNINIVGDGTTCNVVGTPLNNTLTISLVGGGAAVESFITSPTTGTATPSAGVITLAGTGDVTVSAAGSTITINGNPPASSISITGDTGGALTGNAFIFTGGTTGLTFAGSASPNTQTLVGDLVVANGGTGVASLTEYAPICGGTSATGAVQQATTGFSNSGYVLTSTGSGSLPTWQASGGGGAGSNYFYAYVSTSITNVTGKGMGQQYSVIFDSKSLDPDSAYNTSTGVWTAPANGIYMLFTNIVFNGLTNLTSGYFPYYIAISTNSGTGVNTQFINAGLPSAFSYFATSASMIVSLSAGQQASVFVNVIGSGASNTVGLQGNDVVGGAGSANTSFYGYRIA